MSEDEINQVIEKFATAADVCKAAGFSGVQIHAAHGYLLASFLSPNANQRCDQWGGSLHNRARLLMAIIAAVRARVGAAKRILTEHKRLRGVADDAAIDGLRQELAITRLRMIALTGAPQTRTEESPPKRRAAP